MKFTQITAPAVAVGFGLVQFCPAPVNVLILGIAGGEIGGITGAAAGGNFDSKRAVLGTETVEARADDPFKDLPQPAGDQCKGQLQGAGVAFSSTGEGAFRIDNVPSACMTLADVLLGTDQGQPHPTPLGSAALEYTGVSNEDIQKLQAALDSSN